MEPMPIENSELTILDFIANPKDSDNARGETISSQTGASQEDLLDLKSLDDASFRVKYEGSFLIPSEAVLAGMSLDEVWEQVKDHFEMNSEVMNSDISPTKA